MYNHQLDTFIQVADAGSFSKAAEALFISSTAVMKQINLLEGSLEVQLFNRTPRGLTLTNAGKSYYQDAKYMIQYAKDAQVRAKNAMQSNESVIRIGTSLMTPSQFLLDLWPQVHEVHPELKFQMVNFDNTPENAREILANLGQNIDIVAGIFDETMLTLRACDALELMRVPICCAVSIYHPLAQKKKLSAEDFVVSPPFLTALSRSPKSIVQFYNQRTINHLDTARGGIDRHIRHLFRLLQCNCGSAASQLNGIGKTHIIA